MNMLYIDGEMNVQTMQITYSIAVSKWKEFDVMTMKAIPFALCLRLLPIRIRTDNAYSYTFYHEKPLEMALCDEYSTLNVKSWKNI